MAQLYYAYASQDARYKDQLEAVLRGLKQRGGVDSWHGRAVGPGIARSEAASKQVQQADVIVFLLSRDLVAGDYAHSAEVRTALDRHRSGAARVLTVVLRPVPTKGTPFGGLPALPAGGKPVTEWKSNETAFESVTAGIAAALARQDPAAAAALGAGGVPSRAAAERTASALASANGDGQTGATAAPAAETEAGPSAGAASVTPLAAGAVPTPEQVALQPSELGPDYVSLESAGAQNAPPSATRFASVSCKGSPKSRARRVAQLVNRVENAQSAVDRLEAAVRAELAKGGQIDALAVSPEPGVPCKRVRAAQPASTVSVFAAKGSFLVAAKVIDGEPDIAPSDDAAALASNVVRRMLVRIPS